jgi:hypothetical protein
MARIARLLVVWAILGGMLPVAPGSAQTPTPAEPDPLPGLPRPPDQPASLLLPAPPPGPQAPPLPGPYFQADPRLDPPALPPPGWFTEVEAGILGPHVKNHLNGIVQLPGQAKGAMPDRVHVPGADLNWTVAPRLGLGYRLPSGFGEFVLDFRPLASDGTGSLPVSGGAVALKSRLDLNEIDLDYASREFSLWPDWDMKWRFGLRLDYVYFDALAAGPAGAAGGGSTVFAARDTDSYVGLGPHWGLKLGRRLGCTGLSLVGQVDSALNLGRIRQGFFEQGTAVNGGPVAGESHVSSSQAVPMLNAQVGLGWQSAGYQELRFFLGYQYESWWNVGRLSVTPNSRGELSDQGVLLEAEFTF